MCEETAIVVSNSSQSFDWEKYGLKLHIKEGSLPADTKQIIIRIKASLAGQYQSPDDYQRVSAVFWFQCEPPCNLEREAVVEIQHCGPPENTPDLRFARAVCTQEHLPYTFKLVDGGQFSSQSSYGTLELNRFSAVAVFLKKLLSRKRRYYTSLFYLTNKQYTCQQVDILLTWNTSAHLNVSL